MRVYDRLSMLVTGDPVAELDAVLSPARGQLRRARRDGTGRATGWAWARPRFCKRMDATESGQ